MTSKDFRIGNFVNIQNILQEDWYKNNDINVIISIACSKLGNETFSTLDLNKTLTEGPIALIKPIPLIDVWFDIFEFEKDKKKGNFSIGVADYRYVLIRDWRDEPSYHLGIEYTDSPNPKDDGVIYTFSHEIKYVHQLQNIYFTSQHNELNFNYDELQKLIQK